VEILGVRGVHGGEGWAPIYNFVNPCVQVWKFWVSGVCRVMRGGHHSNFVIPCVQVWKFWVSGVCTVVTGGLGTAGNILSLIVLCKRYNSQQAEKEKKGS
jgi:hypothetical protein